jgi:DNA-binding transcriptional LysR family regulator
MPSPELARVNLNLLATFVVVADEGSVTAAARVLGRTQPSITARLKQLEGDLDTRLFERVGRGIALTAIGREVAREAAAVLRGAHDLLDRVRAAEDEPAGILRVGALPTVSAYLLAPALADLARSFPALSVEVHTDLSVPLVDELRRGAIDVVVSVGPIAAPGLRVRAIGAVTPVVALPARPRPPRRLGVADLAARDLVVFHRGPVGDPFFDAAWSFIEQHGLERRVRIAVPHIQSMKELIRAGAGGGLIPDYTLTESELCGRPLRGLRLRVPITLATRRGRTALPAVTELLARIPSRS